jgi:hypothetical protein
MAAVGRRAVLEGRRRMGSFGDRLKKEREQRGISLDDISLTTKIGTRLLRALEEEKFDQLPGGIFNKGFVRAYARYVGLDEDQAVADYMIAIGANLQRPEQAVAIAPPPVPPPPVAAPAPKPRIDVLQEIRRWVPPEQIPWGLLAISLLVIALAFATWSYFHRPQVEEKDSPRLQRGNAACTGNRQQDCRTGLGKDPSGAPCRYPCGCHRSYSNNGEDSLAG